MRTDTLELIQTALLGEAAEHAPIGVFVADDEMRYVALNRYACDLVGYDRTELLEMRVSDISPFPISHELYQEMMRAGSLSGRARLVRKDGAEIEVEFMAVSTRVAAMDVYVSFVRLAEEEPGR